MVGHGVGYRGRGTCLWVEFRGPGKMLPLKRKESEGRYLGNDSYVLIFTLDYWVFLLFFWEGGGRVQAATPQVS